MWKSASSSVQSARQQPECGRLKPVLRSSLRSTESSAAQRRQAQDLAWHWVGAKWPRLLNAVEDRAAREVKVVLPGAELHVQGGDECLPWSLTVAHRERDGGRTWQTRAEVSAVNGAAGDADVFSVETACTPLEQSPPVLALPGVLQLWVDRLGLDDGGYAVLGEARDVGNDDQLDAFLGHVMSPRRAMPILALCHQTGSRHYGVDPQALATAVRGVAHVACLTPTTCAAVVRRWGPDLSPVAGAARLYRPGFTPHAATGVPVTRLAPLWRDPRTPGTPRTADPGAYRRWLVKRLCDWTVTMPDPLPDGSPSAFATTALHPPSPSPSLDPARRP